jgi:hypothetical protein
LDDVEPLSLEELREDAAELRLVIHDEDAALAVLAGPIG